MRLTILLLLTLALFSNMNLSRHSTLVTGAHAPEFDLIIRNGRVIDGSGSAAYNADVAIKGERIVKLAI
jgi:adenine deaminase